MAKISEHVRDDIHRALNNLEIEISILEVYMAKISEHVRDDIHRALNNLDN